jgi:hypothetical protein
LPRTEPKRPRPRGTREPRDERAPLGLIDPDDPGRSRRGRSTRPGRLAARRGGGARRGRCERPAQARVGTTGRARSKHGPRSFRTAASCPGGWPSSRPRSAGTWSCTGSPCSSPQRRVARLSARTGVAELPTPRGPIEPRRPQSGPWGERVRRRASLPNLLSDSAGDGVDLVRRAVVDAQLRSRPGAACRWRGAPLLAAGPTGLVEASTKRSFTTDQARGSATELGIDFEAHGCDLEQFRMRLGVELEHGPRDPGTKRQWR